MSSRTPRSRGRPRGQARSAADAQATEHTRAASDEAAATSAIAQPQLTHASLERSLAHAVSQQHPLAFHACLRHALPCNAPSSGVGTVTLPLSHRTLGMRSLLFARARPLLVATTADCCFLWTHSALAEEPGASEQKSGKGWSCVAILPIAALPALASASSASTPLPCPLLSCAAHQAHTLPRDGQLTVGADGWTPSMRVCFSADERTLFIAVNRAAQSAPLHAVDSPAASQLSQSPLQSSDLLRSPAPRSTPAAAATTIARSPGVGGSQGLESEMDALFATIDEDTPSASASSAKTAPKSRGGRKKRKTIAAEPQAAMLPASYCVYALDLESAAAAITSSSPSQRVASVPSSPAPTAAAPAATGSELDDMDALMSSMLGEMQTQMASPPPAKRGPAAAQRGCTHLRLVCTATAPITAVAASTNSLLVGDANGVVSVWHQLAPSAAWTQRHMLSRVLSASPSSVVSVLPAAERWIAVYSNADVCLWDAGRGVVLQTLNASLHSQKPLDETIAPQANESTPRTPPRGVNAMDVDAIFVGSPTTSTPSHSPLRPGPSSAVDAAIPETPERSSASLSEHASTQLTNPLRKDGSQSQVDGAVTVHAATLAWVDAANSIAQLVMLVSPPSSVGCFESSASPSQTASQQTAPRKSARKRDAAGVTVPPPSCASQLSSMPALRVDLAPLTMHDSGEPALSLLDASAYKVPLLLSDDNASVHATALAASGSQSHSDKTRANVAAGAPASLVAFGLSSGALLLHSARSGKLVALLSDDAAAADAADPNPALRSSTFRTLCDGLPGAVTYAFPFDEQWHAHSSPHQHASGSLSSSQSPGGLFSPTPTAISSPAPSSQRSSTRASPRARGGRSRRPPIELSPPPSAASHASTAAAQLTPLAKHVCTRAVTAVAFHPRYHALMAVGDQEGHVHLFAADGREDMHA